MALPLTHPHHLLFPPTPPTTLPLQIKNTNAKATTLHYSIPTEYPQFKIDACPQKGIHLIAGATVTLRITYLGTRKDDSIGNTSLAQNIQSIKDATNMIRSGILPPISNKAVTGKESESQSKTALIIASPYISLNGVAVALEIAPPTRQIVTINQINFSAIIPQTCTKTIPLKNVGGQTVNWALWTVKPIKCEPSQGHLASQATTKITITWEARSAGAWDAEIFLAYNNTYSIINVSGKGAFHPVKSMIASAAPLSKAMRIRETKKARLSLVGSDHIGFDPIALGDSRKRSFQLSNETDVFMTFKMPTNEDDIEFNSITGEIPPRSTFAIDMEIRPHLIGYNTYTIPIYYGQEGDVDGARIRLKASVEAVIPKLICDQDEIDAGYLVANQYKDVEMTITNVNSCQLKWKLEVMRTDRTTEVTFEKPTGLLLARSDTKIRCRVKTTETGVLDALIGWRFDGIESDELKELCRIRGEAVLPSFAFTDIACSDISKARLRRQFCTSQLNSLFDTHQSSRPVSMFQPPYEFCFNVRPVKSTPSVVHLFIENTGVVPVDWAFVIPENLEIEVEDWVEIDHFSPEEIQQLFNVQNRIFSMSPKSGILLPNQTCTITLTYKHDFIGTHRLPVYLKVQDVECSELLIEFRGTSTQPEERCLHVEEDRWTLRPVDISTARNCAPIQSYTMHNPTAHTLHYAINLESFESLKAENYDFEIIKLHSDAVGTIKPYSTKSVDIVFHPLEAKPYTLAIDIVIDKGRSTKVIVLAHGTASVVSRPMTAHVSRNFVEPRRPSGKRVDDLAYLSSDHITFGHLPRGACSDRIVTLSAGHEDITFNWLIRGEHQLGLSISPRNGTLSAGQKQLCTLTWLPYGPPRLMDVEVVVEVSGIKSIDEPNYKDKKKTTTTDLRSIHVDSAMKVRAIETEGLIQTPPSSAMPYRPTFRTLLLFIDVTGWAHDETAYKDSFGDFTHSDFEIHPIYLDLNARDPGVVLPANKQSIVDNLVQRLLGEITTEFDPEEFMQQLSDRSPALFTDLLHEASGALVSSPKCDRGRRAARNVFKSLYTDYLAQIVNEEAEF